MQKNLYFLLCFMVTFVFFTPIANAFTDISADGSLNQAAGANSAPATIFNGPPPTIFGDPPASIFDGPPPSIFDTNDVSLSQSSMQNSRSPIFNASNSQSTAVEMQKTGIPLTLIIMAILLVIGGFIGLKRKY